MIFICTCSQDTTTDLVLSQLGNVESFRFNIDKPDNFAWDFNSNEFVIIDHANGISIDSNSISSFYLRKPMYLDSIDIPKEGCLTNWVREETSALFEDFYHECSFRGITTIVHSQSAKYGKMRQMLTAKRYFEVPRWHFCHGILPEELREGKWVVKSMKGTQIGENKVFFVRQCDPVKLDMAFPWFLQERIDGEEEVTVVYINGKLYSYSYPRASITDGDDVRKATLCNSSLWTRCAISESDHNAILGYMKETGYKFGRFDFIRKNGVLWFLELNPNGQWAWLDEDNKDGLICAIADEIKHEDEEHRACLTP